MNNQLIEKIIKYSNKSCPELVYSNPLIDKTVARELSKSFVKILSVSKQNTNVDRNIRYCVLENIRKLCGSRSDGHMPVTAEITGVLTAYYKAQVKHSSSSNTLDQRLDEFLARNFQEDPQISSNIDPEVIKSLTNIDCDDTIVKSVIHWNKANKKTQNLLEECWLDDNLDLELLGDLSLKLKEKLEQLILNSIITVLRGDISNLTEVFECEKIQHLIRKCSLSPTCFQVCSRILNAVFIATKFNLKVLDYTQCFIKSVKLMINKPNHCIIYPCKINYLISFMEIDLDSLSKEYKDNHVNIVKEHLKSLELEDLVLLLSHFPQWFNEYFDNQCRHEAYTEAMDLT